ncbi:unnamed protein product, partial [Ceratitis capitata]
LHNSRYEYILHWTETPAFLVKIISSYLSDTLLRYDTDDGPTKNAVMLVVPQGSTAVER